tara:strand:+ start:3357 stop:4109 length:753 start_codon:yes stop_codon:yes gene_type:complete
MKYLLSILCLFSFIFAEYPYFDDINKQLEFEKKKILIIDEKGEELKFFGGGSDLVLANPIGYILGENPSYVAMNNPVQSYTKKWKIFKITVNGKELSEKEFINYIGLKAGIKESEENEKVYIKELDNYYSKLYNEITINKKTKLAKKRPALWHWVGGIAAFIAFMEILDYDDDDDYWEEYEIESMKKSRNAWTLFTIIWYSLGQISVNESFIEKQYPNLQIPQLKRVLTNEQISQLSESYNRSLYDSIIK